MIAAEPSYTEPSYTEPSPAEPSWARPATAALLASTALLYIWGLGASGWANSFYSAAVQAGSVSWKAFLFGSSDAANSITVDKSPLSLWPMMLSVRVFGLSSWSILIPQALEGVAAVAVLTATIRRWFGVAAGLIAGAAMALTPVAVLMFRFNNPDAALVLLLVGAMYAVTRAIEDGRLRWSIATGVLLGLAFLAKELQAFVVIPAIVGAFLVAAPLAPVRRLLHVAAMGAATLVSGGWWVAIVELWPASSRPYIGGSQDNTFLDVLFGYNGLGRLTGDETGSVGGGPTGSAGRWGATGVGRMFNAQFGGQASWLLPAALLVTVAGMIATLRRPRTDRHRAALMLWGGWLVLTAGVFSLSKGIIHEYYAVALAPALGALVGIGATWAWRRRTEPAALVLGAIGVAGTAVWAFVLLGRTPDWLPWLRWAVLSTGAAASAAVLGVGWWARRGGVPRTVIAVPATLAALAVFAGPFAFSLSTAAQPHTGSIVTAGPQTAGASPAAASPAAVASPVAVAVRADPRGAGRPAASPTAVPPAASRAGAVLPAAVRSRGVLPRIPAVGPGACSMPAPPAPSSPRCCSTTPTSTRGSPRRSGRTRPRATSSPRNDPSCPWGASTAAIRRRPSPGSVSSSPQARSTTSSAADSAGRADSVGRAAVRPRPRRRSRPGCRSTSRRRPSGTSRCTTSPNLPAAIPDRPERLCRYAAPA